MSQKTDWEKIKADYVYGGLSAFQVAEKYGVKSGTVRQRAKRYGWAADKAENEGIVKRALQEVVAVQAQKVARAESERIERLQALGAKLEEKLDKAIAELGSYYTVKRKSRGVEANDQGKPSVVETEVVEVVTGDSVIKPADAKAIASALRDLRELQRDLPVMEQSNEDMSVTFEGDTIEGACE